jgi:hypothetical protein
MTFHHKFTLEFFVACGPTMVRCAARVVPALNKLSRTVRNSGASSSSSMHGTIDKVAGGVMETRNTWPDHFAHDVR